MVRKKSEKIDKIFNYVISNMINSLINDLQLIEWPLSDRKFTWAKSLTSDSFALLDRFFCSTCWSSNYSNYIIISLSRLQSDHNPLILKIHSLPLPRQKPIRFEKIWVSQDGFVELFEHWWGCCAIVTDIANQWRLKL
jgi:hypothetical protein